MPHSLRAMITSGGGPGVWGLLHTLHNLPNRKAAIYVQDPDPEPTFGTLFADQPANLPPAADPKYIDALAAFCKHHQIDVLIPVFDGELTKIAQNRARFEAESTRILLPPTELVLTCVDKAKLHRQLIRSDFVPNFRIATTLPEAQSAIKELGYPHNRVCVRPTYLAGGRGLHVLDPNVDPFTERMLGKLGSPACTAKTFLQTRATGPENFDLILTEFLPGDDLGIDLLANNGKVVEMVVRQKCGPMFHGNPIRMRFRDNPDEYAWVTRLAQELRLSGLINIDARYDQDHNLKLIEINARPSACIGMSATRVNLLAWAIDLLLEDAPENPQIYYNNPNATGAMRVLADVALTHDNAYLTDPLQHQSDEPNHARALPVCSSR